MPNQLQIKVPGKLMIAGEYAVLEPYQKAIVIAVDRYITAAIEHNDVNILSLPQLGLNYLTWKSDSGTFIFDKSDPRLKFVQMAMATVHQYLYEQAVPLSLFNLTITSNLDDASGRKYGLGSSAAVVVAVVTAVLNFVKSDEEAPTPDLIFKLSAIAHLKAQGSGSGADVCASTYGGWLLYSSFQPEWLLDRIGKEARICKILEEEWPYLTIKQLSPPKELMLCVGWTGKPVKTGPLIKYIQELRKQNPLSYKEFLKESTDAVETLVTSFELGNDINAIKGISQNRLALARLGDNAGISIETSELSILANLAEKYGGAGKPSGAGGGDCGIAFVIGEDKANYMLNDWQRNEIIPLDLTISTHGAMVFSK